MFKCAARPFGIWAFCVLHCQSRPARGTWSHERRIITSGSGGGLRESMAQVQQLKQEHSTSVLTPPKVRSAASDFLYASSRLRTSRI